MYVASNSAEIINRFAELQGRTKFVSSTRADFSFPPLLNPWNTITQTLASVQFFMESKFVKIAVSNGIVTP